MNEFSKRLFHLSAISLLLLPAGGSAVAESLPNVIFVLADDLGYGDVRSFNPNSKIPTPNIDRLAGEGMRFTDAHAPGSVCVPSRYGLLTGRYPFRTWSSEGESVQERGGRRTPHYRAPMLSFEPERLNLASLMKRNGYATACFGKWHQGMNLRTLSDGSLATTPVDFGFDTYYGFDAPEQGPYAFIKNKRFVSPLVRKIPEQLGENVTNPRTQGAHWYSGDASKDWDFKTCLPRLAQGVDAWIKDRVSRCPRQPFFLYYAIPAPHAPWIASGEFEGKSGAGQYGDYVMTVDAMVERLLRTLDENDVTKETIVFFSSDNGAVWYPADMERYGHVASGSWRGMKGALQEGGHRMPFIVRWPGRIERGSACDQLICFTDLMATMAALVGDELPDSAAEDSVDIMPLLLGKVPAKPIRSVIIHPNWGSYNLAVREGAWKLILPQYVYIVKDGTIVPNVVVETTGKGADAHFQLYNLGADPAEETNVAAQNPGRVQELFEVLRREIESGGG